MEARAHHFLVGLFVLAMGCGLVAFTLWVAKVELNDNRPSYYIYFDGSVTGLKEGSSVRYRGILVGTVSEIRIDPTNVERVRVKVSIDPGTPIKTDAVASLEMSGLTGNAFVQITGGSRHAATLERHATEIPIITSKPSGMAELLEQAPQLAHQLTEIGVRVTRLLSAENEQRFHDSLDNLHQMSVDLAASAHTINETMATVKSTALHLDALFGSADSTLVHVRSTLDSLDSHANVAMEEVVKTSGEAQTLSQSLRALSDQLGGLIKDNRLPVRDFTSVGLYELSLLISEMRELTTSLSRVSSQIEKGPMEFLFTGTKKETDKPK